MTAEIVEIKRIDIHDVRITVKWTKPGIIGWIFGDRPYTDTYQGGGTVWHRHPSGVRCPTWMEMALSDLKKHAEYNDLIKNE